MLVMIIKYVYMLDILVKTSDYLYTVGVRLIHPRYEKKTRTIKHLIVRKASRNLINKRTSEP